MRALLSLFLLLFAQGLLAQATATLRGTVRDETGATLPLATVSIPGTSTGTICNEQGVYRLTVPAGRTVKVMFSFSGAQPYVEEVILNEGEERVLDARLRFITLKPLSLIHISEPTRPY